MTFFLYSCGDDSLGRLPRHEDAKCGNMNLLLGQKERVSKFFFILFQFFCFKNYFLKQFHIIQQPVSHPKSIFLN